MTLPGPSKTIIVEPLKAPAKQPRPATAPPPRKEPAKA
jgi:hypothetical protein